MIGWIFCKTLHLARQKKSIFIHQILSKLNFCIIDLEQVFLKTANYHFFLHHVNLSLPTAFAKWLKDNKL